MLSTGNSDNINPCNDEATYTHVDPRKQHITRVPRDGIGRVLTVEEPYNKIDSIVPAVRHPPTGISLSADQPSLSYVLSVPAFRSPLIFPFLSQSGVMDRDAETIVPRNSRRGQPLRVRGEKTGGPLRNQDAEKVAREDGGFALNSSRVSSSRG